MLPNLIYTNNNIYLIKHLLQKVGLYPQIGVINQPYNRDISQLVGIYMRYVA